MPEVMHLVDVCSVICSLSMVNIPKILFSGDLKSWETVARTISLFLLISVKLIIFFVEEISLKEIKMDFVLFQLIKPIFISNSKRQLLITEESKFSVLSPKIQPIKL